MPHCPFPAVKKDEGPTEAVRPHTFEPMHKVGALSLALRIVARRRRLTPPAKPGSPEMGVGPKLIGRHANRRVVLVIWMLPHTHPIRKATNLN